MRLHNFFGHDNPYDNRLRTLLDRIHVAKDPQLESFMFFGENIARHPMLKAGTSYTLLLKDGRPHFMTNNGEILPYTCTELAQAAVDGWMNLPGHRANILNPKFGFIGCGCSRILERRHGYTMVHYLLTQDFGGRSPSSR